MKVRRWIEDVRYEAARWPLWRWDQNLRYIAKSLLHRSQPRTEADRAHFAESRAFLEGGTWKRGGDRLARICAVGDLMWVRSRWAEALSPGVRAKFAAADLRIANLETPIDPSQPVKRFTYETIHYNAPPEYLTPWSSPAVFSLCNNHALDQGRSGLEATRHQVLSREGFSCVGGVDHEDAVALVNVNGVRLGFFGLTFSVNPAGRGDPSIPAGIPLHRFGDPAHEPDWSAIRERLESLRARGAEKLVVLAHWGYEYEYWPDARMREHAHRLVALGADVILGTSPHVLQPLELVSVNQFASACPAQVTRAGAPGLAVIAYSLGNFLSIMPTLACRTGAILSLDFTRDDTGPQLAGLELTPTACFEWRTRPEEAARVFTLDEVEPRRARAHAAHAQAILGTVRTDQEMGS